MRCVSPILIRRAKSRDYVPCGKCNNCLQTKRASWSFRLMTELRQATSASFLTLTYDEATAPRHESGALTLRKSDVQLFIKRLRKLQAQPIRYYACGEYGTQTLRPHYHIILFNLDPQFLRQVPNVWGLGHVHRGDVTMASIHYTTKYVINRTTDYPGRDPPFALMSRRPGIGACYEETHKRYHRKPFRTIAMFNGIPTPLPRYYKEKFFSSEERKRLANEAVVLSDEQYVEELRRLQLYHDDPAAYFDECARASHELVRSKVNSLNTF